MYTSRTKQPCNSSTVSSKDPWGRTYSRRDLCKLQNVLLICICSSLSYCLGFYRASTFGLAIATKSPGCQLLSRRNEESDVSSGRSGAAQGTTPLAGIASGGGEPASGEPDEARVVTLPRLHKVAQNQDVWVAAQTDSLWHQKVLLVADLQQRLSRMVTGKPIMGTIAGSGFKDMFLNWIAHVHNLNISNVLVAAVDDEIEEICTENNIAFVSFAVAMPSTNFRWGSEFLHMGGLKTAFILSVLEQGWDILMSDTDVAWLRDPSAYLARDGPLSGADILMSTDSTSLQNDITTEGVPVDQVWSANNATAWYRRATPRGHEIMGNIFDSARNTGILLLRSHPCTLALAARWHRILRTLGKSEGWKKLWGDQFALNEILNIDSSPAKVVRQPEGTMQQNRIIWAYNGTVRLAILPVGMFCSGHTYFVQKSVQAAKLRPYAVHATFHNYGTDGKVARFREHSLWLVEADSYFSEGNYLSFSVTLPPHIEAMPSGVDKHVAAMEYYFEVTRRALVVARIGSRALILPRVTCYCDSWWNYMVAPCRGHGTDVDPPFDCPIDYFINLPAWNSRSAKLLYRPSTFLNDPRTDAIQNSRVEIFAGLPNGKSVGVPVAPAYLMQPNATNKEVWRVMRHLQEFRHVHLVNAADSFCMYEDSSEATGFDLWSASMFHQTWCCTPEFKSRNITIPPLEGRTREVCSRT